MGKSFALSMLVLLAACGGPAETRDDSIDRAAQPLGTYCSGCTMGADGLSSGQDCSYCKCAEGIGDQPNACQDNLQKHCRKDLTISCTGDTCQCTDLVAGRPATCRGRCGDYNSMAPCQCDAVCSTYGDCCADKGSVCGAKKCSCDAFCGINGNCCAKCGF
jgi:hypothetical protein